MSRDIITIIIVEDNEKTQELYKDSIDDYNSESSEFEIKYFILKNDENIPNILYQNHIDAIIIDLDWGTGKQKYEGNALVKKIRDDCRIPIFIVSGNLQSLDEEYEESPILKKYQRDEVDNSELFDEIAALYKTGYTTVLGNHSEIDKMLSKVFWNHMSGVLDSWENQEIDTKKQRMLRFAVTRINEMLTINTDDKHDSYDALEYYIKPMKKKAFTGDIVCYEDEKYVVITASCDMEQGKSDFVVLCKIDFKKFEELKSRVEKRSNSAEKKLENYINNKEARWHLLPPCSVFDGGFVDFQMVRSVDRNDFFETAKVIVSINQVFHKDIQARFSHYYGRQGQPQLSKEDIIGWIRSGK